MHPQHRPEPGEGATAATQSTLTSGQPRRDRRALLGAALGAAATVAIAPIAASARTVTVQGITGTIGPTGATGAVGATGGAVPELALVSAQHFFQDGTGFYWLMFCPEPDMIAFSFGWKNAPPGWMPWRRYHTTGNTSQISVGFIDNRDDVPPNEGNVELQVFCLRATLAQDPG